jgi:hypothetical protein
MANHPHFRGYEPAQHCSASHANLPCRGQTSSRERVNLCDSCLINYGRAQRAGDSLPHLTGLLEGRGKN